MNWPSTSPSGSSTYGSLLSRGCFLKLPFFFSSSLSSHASSSSSEDSSLIIGPLGLLGSGACWIQSLALLMAWLRSVWLLNISPLRLLWGPSILGPSKLGCIKLPKGFMKLGCIILLKGLGKLGCMMLPKGFVKKGSSKGVVPPKKLDARLPGRPKPPKPAKGSPKLNKPCLPPLPPCMFCYSTLPGSKYRRNINDWVSCSYYLVNTVT